MSNAKDSLCKLKEEIELIVKRLGGPSATARMFTISDAAVQQWKANGLPEARELYLRYTRPEVLVGTRWEVKTPEEA